MERIVTSLVRALIRKTSILILAAYCTAGLSIEPTVVDDNFSTAINQALQISEGEILSNDSGNNGLPIFVEYLDDWSGGIAHFNTDTRQITFTPETDFVGSATFVYAVYDGVDRFWGAVNITVGDGSSPTPPDENPPSPEPPEETPPADPVVKNSVNQYTFNHSLWDHSSVINVNTNTGYWVGEFALAGNNTYRWSGEFGQLDYHNLPPFPQLGSLNSAGEDSSVFPVEGALFSQIHLDNIIIMPPNFVQGDLTSVQPEFITQAQRVIDWVVSNDVDKGQKPEVPVYIYEHWQEATADNLSSGQWQAYHAVTLGNYHQWFLDYQNKLHGLYPNNDIRMIPVGPVIADILQNANLQASNFTFPQLYEDESPHGTTDLYFLAGLITYQAMFGQEAPSDFAVPSNISPLIAGDFPALNQYVWERLNHYNTNGVRIWSSSEANRSPVLVDYLAQTQQNTILSIPLANLMANTSDPDGDTVSFVGVINPQNGNVNYDAETDNIIFEPALGFTGQAHFIYQVTDGQLTAEGNVFIDVITEIDTDGDGVPDSVDAFPNDPTESIDTDGDGIGDNADPFPTIPNETEEQTFRLNTDLFLNTEVSPESLTLSDEYLEIPTGSLSFSVSQESGQDDVLFSNGHLIKAAPEGYNNGSFTSNQLLGANADGWVEFQLSDASADISIGFAANGETGFSQRVHQLYIESSHIAIYESGEWIDTELPPYVAGDTYRIERVGLEVRYSRNGAVFHISPQTTAHELQLDGQIVANGSRLNQVQASFTQNDAGSDPYYIIQAHDSWPLIATRLYGSEGAADELREFFNDQPLGEGILNNPPMSLIDDDREVTVPGYYILTAATDWAGLGGLFYNSEEVAGRLEALLSTSYNLVEGERILQADMPSSITVTVVILTL